jgi:transcription termination/antitermination protein NusG
VYPRAILSECQGPGHTKAIDAGPDANTSPNWYAVMTRSRHEKKVRDQLLGASVETFLPVYNRWSQWKDRKKLIDFPLFPGYCFARFPLADHARVRSVHGVAGVLGNNGHPEPIPGGEVDALRRLIMSRFHLDPHPFLEVGDTVEVVRGPLAGVRGKLLRKDAATRLVISVTLIRQSVVVLIHPADVAAI